MKGLYLDFEEARMAAGYLRRAMNVPATFSLSVRRLPHRPGGYPAGLRGISVLSPTCGGCPSPHVPLSIPSPQRLTQPRTYEGAR